MAVPHMLREYYNQQTRHSHLWNPYTQAMPREKLDQLHLRRIQLLMKHAYRNTPFYRQLYDRAGVKPEDIRTWDDFFHKAPFTDNPDLIQDQIDKPFAAQALPDSSIHQFFTTPGTTGAPFRYNMSYYDSIKFGTSWAYQWWEVGMRSGDSAYFCFDFGKWVGFWVYYWTCRQLGLMVLSGSTLRSEERVREIIKFRPTAVLGSPTYLLHLGILAREAGLHLKSAGVKFLVAGGEAGLNVPMTRAELINVWGGATPVESYGIGECGIGGMECSAHAGGVHDNEDNFHAYSIDPDSRERVPDGQVGENIITAYTRTSQPFIKYRTHDLVERHYNVDHGCGSSWAFLQGSVLGRTDFIVKIRGVNVYPTAIENLLGQMDGVTRYYEMHIDRRDGLDHLLVKVEAQEGVPQESYHDVAGKAETFYRSTLGVKIGVEVLAPKSLPRYELKTKRIFDNRPKDVKMAAGRG
ncbi:MAG: phenylacetate--CoA ligase family protein [Dehalococcoidia bacterium]|nr:phenylacetate--CoA ligase family protein [Dehalococcoidia bacterium]